MFGWGRKKNDAVTEIVSTQIQVLFKLLELRLGGLPSSLTHDAYVIGFVAGTSVIFAQIETAGRANTELQGLAALTGLMAAFAPINFSIQDASTTLKQVAGNTEAKRGSRAAELIMGALLGKHDYDDQPEVIAAREAIAAMPPSIKILASGPPQTLLVSELQERLFFAPIQAKHQLPPNPTFQRTAMPPLN